MSHNVLPGLLSSICFCMQMTALTVSIPLARDITTKIDQTYYKLGHKAVKHIELSTPSAFSLRALALLERKIYNELINYCTAPPPNSTSCSAAQAYIQDYEETSLIEKNSKPVADFTKVVAGNMNAIYRMIRRFREDIQQWISRPSSKFQRIQMDDVALLQRIKGLYNPSTGPYQIDMHVAIFAIALTQFQLDLKAEDIAQGIFQGRETRIKLKAIHCLEIGLHSTVTGLYPVGMEWLEHALHKVQHGDNTTSEAIVEEYLNQAKAKHDQNWQSENGKDMQFVFYERPLNQTPHASERKWSKLVTYTRVPNETLSEKFWSLCNNGNQREVFSPKLFCWRETNIHPFWTIGPLKAELLSSTPNQVIQFHDIIGPEKTSEVQRATPSDFFPPEQGFTLGFYPPRVKLCGVGKSLMEHPEIHAKLEKLGTVVTGLNVKEKNGRWYEPFFLTSYAAGGHNSVHPDWSPEGSIRQQAATFVIYLDTPELGGATVLPKLGLAAKALKGSAILWYNVHSSGRPALKSIHGGCPVLLGHKFIALKSIEYKNQDHLMCDEDEKAGFDYLGNGRAKLRFSKRHQNPSVRSCNMA